MTHQEYEVLIDKAIKNAPDWLKTDLEQIAAKEKVDLRISYVISELHQKYTFNVQHIIAAMGLMTSEWTVTSRHRLNYIDNNIDLIQHMIKRINE
ncbi:hypothetical protein [Bacillus sp. FJAT-50079]|uniref:hypothetical protein n=1 Tax=Bacillus sp. FJAT-50079 TaxID=2833577 RepID=UPI001BC9F10F|nr:hypothetical protein [Bacillus sp. FJAT-50079]MBS4208379.1 hypothetical protein [Bacillus sp. FJAT-50079]